ncbi:MAG: hypothetical protein V4541_10500 [Bacteroidota bacterium]
MKKILLISALLIIANLSKAQWDKTQEILLINKAFTVAKSYGLTDIQCAEYSSCVLSKMKLAIPDFNKFKGTGEDARKIGLSIGLDCLSNFLLKWTPELETTLRIEMMNSKKLSILKDEVKLKFADCCINSLKAKSPNGVYKLSERLLEEVATACMEQQIKNN